MRLANGLFWSSQKYQIEAIIDGKRIAVMYGRLCADEQYRGAFREQIARLLLAGGNPMEFVLRFSCSKVKRLPEFKK